MKIPEPAPQVAKKDLRDLTLDELTRKRKKAEEALAHIDKLRAKTTHRQHLDKLNSRLRGWLAYQEKLITVIREEKEIQDGIAKADSASAPAQIDRQASAVGN